MIWYFTGKILMDHISGAISNWFNQIVSKDSVKQKASHTQKELNEQRDLHTQKELDNKENLMYYLNSIKYSIESCLICEKE